MWMSEVDAKALLGGILAGSANWGKNPNSPMSSDIPWTISTA
jgi:hypothetical protein